MGSRPGGRITPASVPSIHRPTLAMAGAPPARPVSDASVFSSLHSTKYYLPTGQHVLAAEEKSLVTVLDLRVSSARVAVVILYTSFI